MPNYDPDAPAYDYTQDDGSVPFDPLAYLDQYEIADVDAPNKSADEIADSHGGFAQVPVGIHDLVIVGFLTKKDNPSPFTPIAKDLFLGSTKVLLRTDSTVVKLALVADRNQQVTDNFWLPPEDATMLRAYYEGSKKPNAKGSAVGFMADKFFSFMGKIGFIYPKGGKLPPEARKPRNWIGKTVRAEVIEGDPFEDPTTGESKPGRNQIKLFSYQSTRDVGSKSMVPAGATQRPAAAPGKAITNGAQGTPAARRPAVAAAANDRGLSNI